jgi:hypothetical protein
MSVGSDDGPSSDWDRNGIGCESGQLVGLYIEPAVLRIPPDPLLAG